MKRVSGPSAPIVSLEDAKMQMRIDSDAEDALIQGYLDAAIGWIDGLNGVLGRCATEQVWQASADEVACGIKPYDVTAETENADGSIDYTCAMPAESVPQVSQAVLMLAAYWYDQRMASVASGWNEAPFAVRALLSPLRVWA